MTDRYQRAVARFRDWLIDFSPYFAELRSEVFVHDDAPLLLGRLWETLGWSPGVGFGGLHQPMRPERHVTRAAAERTFKAWGEGSNGREGWARLPARPWVLYAKTWERNGRDPGDVTFVDEDAGDDPPLLKTQGERVKKGGGIATRDILRATVRWHGHHRRVGSFALVPPRKPNPFEPALEGFWQLARGVWGLADGGTEGKRAKNPRLDLYYRRAEDLIDYLVTVSPKLGRLPGFVYEAQFLLKDLKMLQPDQLLARGFLVVKEKGRPSAVGRLDGLPFIVHPHSQAPNGTVHVPMEYVKQFRELMKQQKLSAYQTLIAGNGPIVAPRPADRALVKKLWQQAQAPASSRPPRPASAAKALAERDSTQLPIEKEATRLRELLARACPELELEPVKLTKQEPHLVRAFWATLGWCPELSSIIGWPDRAASRHQLAEALRDYRSSGTPLKRTMLPKLFRVARVDDQGVGIMFTDETKGTGDPALLFASSDTGKVSVVASSYLRWVIEELLDHVDRHGGPVDAAPTKKLARRRK